MFQLWFPLCLVAMSQVSSPDSLAVSAEGVLQKTTTEKGDEYVVATRSAVLPLDVSLAAELRTAANKLPGEGVTVEGWLTSADGRFNTGRLKCFVTKISVGAEPHPTVNVVGTVGQYVAAGEMIVAAHANSYQAAIQACQDIGASVIKSDDEFRLIVCKWPEGRLPSVLRLLKTQPTIKYVHPNYRTELRMPRAVIADPLTGKPKADPNKPAAPTGPER